VNEAPVKKHLGFYLLLLGMLFAPESLQAEQKKPPSNEMLLERIEQLEKAAAQQTKEQMIAEIRPKYPSLNIIGFGNISFSATDERGEKTGYRMGQFVLHFSSALSPRVSYFGEVSITPRKDAGTGDPTASGFDVELERNIIRFDQGDHFKIAFGRFHTPINWWNATFHHGVWLHTTIDRPGMIGSFIPVHFLGLILEGTIGPRSLNLVYNAGVGNGRAKTLGRAGDAGDVNNSKAWMMNVRSQPDQFFGLEVGLSAYSDKIKQQDGRIFDEMILSAHLIWNKENPEVISEISQIHHDAKTSGKAFDHQAFYLQAAYRLPWAAARFKPYVRYEYSDINRADPAFETLSLAKKRTIGGLRIDVSAYAAFKLEYRNEKNDGVPEINSGLAQVSFTF